MTKDPRDEWITLNELSFHIRDWGGTGQPVVLLHGLASTCHIWDLVAPILADDYAVVALDQRGHGLSAKPNYGYDFATVGGDLLALINGKEMKRPLIVGHSWGGDVALEFAVANPDVPMGLCFVDGGTIEPSARHETLEQAKEQMAPPVFTGVTIQEFSDRIRARRTSMRPEAQDIVLANFEVLEDNTIRAWLSRDNHLRIIEALWEHHPSALYSQVKCPVLIMPARQQNDPSTAERMSRRAESIATVAELLPVSKTVWLEDSVHDVPIQRPELVAGVIKQNIVDGFFTA